MPQSHKLLTRALVALQMAAEMLTEINTGREGNPITNLAAFQSPDISSFTSSVIVIFISLGAKSDFMLLQDNVALNSSKHRTLSKFRK